MEKQNQHKITSDNKAINDIEHAILPAVYVVDLNLQHVKPLCSGRHPCYTSYPKESPQATNEPIKNY